jgi:ligand-binding sensor domain-containing protein
MKEKDTQGDLLKNNKIMDLKNWLSILLSFGSFFILSQPQLTNYNQNNSPLPFNTVRCIAIQDSIKWFGTDDGLARFDNQNWTIYNSSNSPLTSNDIRALKVENDSILWIGTISGGVFRFNGINWINYTEFNSGLLDNLVRGIEIDLEDNIWFATTEGISMFDRINWYHWTIASHGLQTNNITSIGIGLQNEKYIGTINGGLDYFTPNNQLTIHSIVESGLPDNSALDIDIDANGKPWFATPAAGLVTDLGNGGPWDRFNMSNSPIPTNGLTCLAIDPFDQRIFMGTELNGILIKKENIWFSYNMENIGLQDNYITSLTHENNQIKWAGTYDHGVIRIEENTSGQSDNQLTGIQIYPTLLSAGESINIDTEDEINQVYLFNDLGSKIYIDREPTNQIKLPTSLGSGNYILQISLSNSIVRKKIVVL